VKNAIIKQEYIVDQNRLSRKETGFVKDYIITGNGTEAAMRNCKVKNRNSAAVVASRMLRNVKVSAVIKNFADMIPDELLIQKHLELLNAKKKVRSLRKGEIVIEVEEMDSTAVAKGLDMAYSLKHYYQENPDTEMDEINPTLKEINQLIKTVKENTAQRQRLLPQLGQ
jgi:hypothetical protein